MSELVLASESCYIVCMDNFTQTAHDLKVLQDTHHVPQNFIWDLTGYSLPLLKDARRRYIEFMGPTLKKIDDATDFCSKVAQSPDITIEPADFIAHHAFLINDETGKSYTTAWARLATGDMTWAEAFSLVRTLDHVVGKEELMNHEGPLAEDMRLVRKLKSRQREVDAAEGRYTPIPLLSQQAS